MELVVLIGLQASGKSTFRVQTFDATHVLVSKDRFPNNRSPARRQTFLVDEALSAGLSVVVDNTNPRRTDRSELIEAARRHGAAVHGFYLSSSLEDALMRNRLRSGKARVPDKGVLSTASVLERPSLSEGFDALYYVRMDGSGGFIVEAWEE